MATQEKLQKSLEALKNLSKHNQPSEQSKKKEKVQFCYNVTEAISNPTIRISPNFQTLLGISVETFLLLCDDQDADIRMTSEECLNRIIRAADGYVGKIQIELHKEIKKNGAVRPLRAALWLFSALAHNIRPHKGKPYAANMFPNLVEIAKRTEESLHETLAASLPKIMKALGCFTTENEIKILLKAFLANISNESAVIRRTNINCILTVCAHCRKPDILLSYCLSYLLDQLIPVTEDSSCSLILGAMSCIKSSIPTLLSTNSDWNEKTKASINEQLLQVFELCLHYLNYKDHNVVNVCLETLNVLLQNCPRDLRPIFLSNKGLGCQRIYTTNNTSDSLKHRTPSQLSVATNLTAEDNLFSESELTETLHSDIEKWIDESKLSVMNITFAKTKEKSVSLDKVNNIGTETERNLDTCDYGKMNELNRENFVSKLKTHSMENTLDILSLSDNSSEKSFSLSTDDKIVNVDEEILEIDIGNISDEVPLVYCIRMISKLFLLSGTTGVYASDKTVRVSVKFLSLSCLSTIFQLYPTGFFIYLDKNFTSSSNFSGKKISKQGISDVLLFRNHPDPQLRGAVRTLIGSFLKTVSSLCEGGYEDWIVSNCDAVDHTRMLQTEKFVSIFIEGLKDDSSTCVRQTLISLDSSLKYILDYQNGTSVIALLNILPILSKNPYWLVKVSLCELVSKIDYISVYHVTENDDFQNKVIYNILFELLGDSDQRVRTSAALSIVGIIPRLYSKEYFVNKPPSTSRATLETKRLTQSFVEVETETNVNKKHFIKQMPFPFNKLCNNFCDRIDFTLSKIIARLCNMLLTSTIKNLVSGCIETLSRLSNAFPCTVYKNSWCTRDYQFCENLKIPDLLNLCLSLLTNSVHVYGLQTHIDILNLTCNLYAGQSLPLLKPINIECTNSMWSMFSNDAFQEISETYLNHTIKLLNIFHHVLNDSNPAQPHTKVTLPNLPAASSLSPLKRRKSDLDRKTMNAMKYDKEEKADKKDYMKTSSLGCFAQSSHYMKIFDTLKSSFSNYKMSIDSVSSQTFLELLVTTLQSLSVLMEVSSLTEFGKIAEDILIYLRSTFVVEASATVECVQQLLKCLFGTNLMANITEFAEKKVEEQVGEQGFYHNVFQKPYNLISQFYVALNNISRHDFDDDSTVMGYLHRTDVKRRSVVLSRSSDKILAEYIRIFEPMVIKSLKQYTVTSDVRLQCQVLQLLSQLVQLRVNYCLLDSEQVFIGFVIKQFEFIEEGQVPSTEELIPKIFQFLVQLSYSKHHSKCIIGVPKIIQLCDGLMASGQPSLTHCIPALEPLVEDIFLSRNKSNTSDVKELETTREVVLSMLLRLCDDIQVLDLISLILEDSKYCTDNTEKWYDWSKRVFSVVLPRLKQNKLKLDSSDALSSMRRFILALNPEVFKPFDEIIIMFFQDPPPRESDLASICGWLSKILVLLFVITPVKEETLLSKINKLKHEFSPGSIYDNVVTKADPLNVNNNADTFQRIPAEMIFCRLLFRIVSIMVKQCLLFVREGQEAFLTEQFSGLLLQYLYLFQSGNHRKISSTALNVVNQNIPYGEDDVLQLSEINENFINLAAFHPVLTAQWCNCLTPLNFNDEHFWSKVFAVDIKVLNERQNKFSIDLEIMKVGGVVSFCDYLSENISDADHVTWFLRNNSPFLVALLEEPPVLEFISSVHRNPSFSEVFIRSISGHIKNARSSVDKVKVLKCIENCHQSQIGPVLNLLIPDMLKCHQAVVSRMAANLASRKIEMLLMMPMEDVSNQLSKETLTKIQRLLVSLNLVKKHETLVSLLNKLSVQYYDLSPIEFEQRRVVNPQYIKKLNVNRTWYLSQIQAKCNDANIGNEMAELLSQIEYHEIISFMCSDGFNKSCLKDCLRLGLENIRKQKLTAESDLISASIDCVLKDIDILVSKMPSNHQVSSHFFIHIFLFENAAKILFNVLYQSSVQEGDMYMNRVSNNQISDNNLEEIMRFAVLCLEYVSHLTQVHSDDFKVHVTDMFLNASNGIFRKLEVCNLLGLDSNVTWFCSTVNSIYRLVNLLLRNDRPVPSVPTYALNEILSNVETIPIGHAVHQMYTLSCWLFEQKAVNQSKIPDFLFKPIKSLVIRLSRIPLVNSYILVPHQAWKTGWQPDVMSGLFKTQVPSLPLELLKEIDVLQEYILRVTFLGWTSRQQFEETWMCLLSVLCIPLDNLDPLEMNETSHASSLAIKAITALLLETLTSSMAGNPNISKLIHISRNLPLDNGSVGVRKLHHIQNQISLSYDNSLDIYNYSNIFNVFECRNLEKISKEYSCGQVSVEYFLNALGLKEPEQHSLTAEIFQSRKKMLEDYGLDINSCLQFLIDYYTQLMKPQSNTHIRVLHEAVRSTVMISDLFSDKSQFSWMMDVFLELSKLHPVEDEFIHQYLIVGICKAVAVLSPELEVYEQVKKLLMQYLKSPYLVSRMSCVQGLLYILEGCKFSNTKIGGISEELQLMLPCAVEYVQFNLNNTNSVLKKSQEHSTLVWSLTFYLIENVEEVHMEQNFVTNTLVSAFSSLNKIKMNPLDICVIKGLERLLIIKKVSMMERVGKQFLKLALDKMRNDNPVSALLGTQLLLTYMYIDCANHLQNVQTSDNTPTSPDHLVQTMEKISAIFERIKKGYVHEVEILCSVLPDILNDFFSPSDILTKVIGEFLSSQQPHPKLLSKVVFQVFLSAIQRNQLPLLQDWVVFSLSNFTQSFSIGMATWCLTCFFISASTNNWLRSYFSYVQTRVGRYEYEDRKMLCIAGADFFNNLTNDKQRQTFIDNFTKVMDQPDTPYKDLLLSL
nr:huntingtin [Leptinotarsa decemlineata]